MKKTIGTVGVFVLSLLLMPAQAQQTTPAAEPSKWDPKKNPTVDSLISPYQSKILPARAPLTTEDIFPVIGKYESATNADAARISIMLDEQNNGLVWVEGLPKGKIKAMLRKSPATYKIPVQKNEAGKDVAEGTLIFDKETNTLSICIGKPFDAANPAGVFLQTEEPATATPSGTSGKKKPALPRAWIYTGTKQVKETASN
jgi:hypothetical protein